MRVKRLVAWTLLLCLWAGILPTNARAAGVALTEGSAEYEELDDFLFLILCWGSTAYDFRSISTQDNNILQTIISYPSCYMGPTPSVDAFYGETEWYVDDPLGKWNGQGYHKTDITQVVWILENVFNCSQTDISNLQSSLSSSAWEGYYLDGYYYSLPIATGWFFTGAITDITPYENYYFITYEMRHSEEAGGDLLGRFFAVVQQKTIAETGRGYWSLYYLRELADDETIELPTAPGTPSVDNFTDVKQSDYFYNAERLNHVTDPASAAEAVRDMVGGMTQEQKKSPTGIDLATLYAETAAAKAVGKTVTGSDILIDTAAVADLEAEAAEALTAVEDVLTNGGITTARYLSKTMTLLTDETDITVRVDPDVLGTEADKIRVETPDYALTFKLSDLAPDLANSLTFKAAPASAETLSVKNAVDIEVPGGSMAAPITVSLPADKDTDATYQAVVNQSTGTVAASKYNPATTDIDSKVNTSGTYTVKTNEIDFTDITSKSTEMQQAIKYLAAHGIVMGSGGTNYSPNDSISRAELTALVLRALGKVDSKATTSFTDVTPANWYYATAASSQKLGYITGFEDNTFRGTVAINKEQIIVVAARVLGAEMNYKTPSNPAAYLSKYSDTVVSWAQPQVALATRENLVVYRTDGTFSGAKNMTRGDAAIITYRLFQRIW